MAKDTRTHGNRFTGSSGITQREATQLHSMWHKLNKLSKKENLYVGYKRKVLEAQQIIYELLESSDRL